MAVSYDELQSQKSQVSEEISSIDTQIQEIKAEATSNPSIDRREALRQVGELRRQQADLKTELADTEQSISQLEQNRRDLGLDPETGEPLPEPVEEEPVEEEPVEEPEEEPVEEEPEPVQEEPPAENTEPKPSSTQSSGGAPAEPTSESESSNGSSTSSQITVGAASSTAGQGPIPNPLSAFSSYNCIFTFGVSSKNQLGSSVRQDPIQIVIKSGGTGNNQVKTASEINLGITTEYFIDDVEIESIISPTSGTRQTNATKISFKVTEPYSMGNFLQSLANAAINQGYQNYIDAGWLLTIDFVGFDDAGRAIKPENTKRYFPLKLTNVTFAVTAGGSEYSVEAIPYNEQALSDEVQAVKEDIDIKGITVGDFLVNGVEFEDSLQLLLNSRDENLKESGQKKASDYYVFTFPNGKKIQDAKIPRAAYDPGNQLFGEAEELEDGVIKRRGVTLYAEERRLNFKKGTRIQEIIEELIILSDYGRELVKQEPDSDGMKTWFKIRTVVYPQTVDPASYAQRGRSPKVFWYQISEYKYHSSKTNSPTVKAPGIENLKNKAVKQYNYIYSGVNDDILDFTLEFDTAFYQALSADMGQLGQSQVEGGAGGTEEREQEPIPVVSDGRSPRPGVYPSVEDGSANNTGGIGGPTDQSTANRIARSLNEAIINGVDLLTLNLEILGDPYYIADSEVGAYNSTPAAVSPNINEDGSIASASREVDVLLNFRTPIDIGRDGFMKFPQIDSQPVSQFSGLYQVITVRNSISQNKFIQELKLIRRKNQEGEESANSNITKEGDPEKALGETADRPEGYFDGQLAFMERQAASRNQTEEEETNNRGRSSNTGEFATNPTQPATRPQDRTDQEREEQGDEDTIIVDGPAKLPNDANNRGRFSSTGEFGSVPVQPVQSRQSSTPSETNNPNTRSLQTSGRTGGESTDSAIARRRARAESRGQR